MKKLIFKPGRRLRSLNQVWEANVNREWLYLYKTPKHPSVLVNMSLVTISGFLGQGYIRRAVRR